MACVSTYSVQILWNGSAMEKFNPTRGIWQGDPFSPYLFMLCIESLAHGILYAVHLKQWKPITLRRRGPEISHLFFTDDLILFAKVSLSQADIINQYLDLFCKSSVQKVSQEKIRVFFSKNINHNRAKEISDKLGFKPTSDLRKYLGVTLHHKRVTKATYGQIISKIQQNSQHGVLKFWPWQVELFCRKRFCQVFLFT